MLYKAQQKEESGVIGHLSHHQIREGGRQLQAAPVVSHVSDGSLVAIELLDACCGHHVMHGHGVIDASAYDVTAIRIE